MQPIFGLLEALSISKLRPPMPRFLSASPFGVVLTPPPIVGLASLSLSTRRVATPTPSPPPPAEEDASSGATVVVSMQQRPQSSIDDIHALAASFARESGVDSSRRRCCMTLDWSLSIVLLLDDIALRDILIVERSDRSPCGRERARGTAAEGVGPPQPEGAPGTSLVGVRTIVLSIPTLGDAARCCCCGGCGR